MKLRIKIAIVVLLFAAAGTWAISAFGGMPPVYGEKMLRNILLGNNFSEKQIDAILALPRLPDFNLGKEKITIRPGRQLWVEDDMSFAVIVNVGNNDFEVTETLFYRHGEK